MMQIDPHYGITPYMKRIAEHQVGCAAILHSIVPNVWELGELTCNLALLFTNGEMNYSLPDQKLPSQVSEKLSTFKERVSDALKRHSNLFPAPTKDFPRKSDIALKLVQ